MASEERVDSADSFSPREHIAMGILFLMIVLGVFFTWEEIQYSISGVTTKATILGSEEVEGTTQVGRRRYKDNMTMLTYEFTDSRGKSRQGEVMVYPEHVKTLSDADGKIEVMYLRKQPAVNTPVLMRHTSYVIGFCSLAGVALLIYAFYFFKLRPGILEEQRRDALR